MIKARLARFCTPLLFVFCLSVSASCGDDDTNVSNNNNNNDLPCPEPTEGPTVHDQDVSSDEVWTAAGSPHMVDSSIEITATVTIEPCSVVELAPGVSITVSDGGALVAEGEESRPIQFRGQQTEPWAYIKVDDPGTASLAYVSVEGGGADEGTYRGATLVVTDSGIRPGTRPLRVEQVTLSGSVGLGILFQGLAGFDPQSSGLTISDSGAALTEQPYPILISPEAAGTVPSGTYTGNAEDVIAVGQGPDEVQIDATWSDRGVPYRLLSGVVIDEGGSLTVTEGAVLELDPEISIFAHGEGEGALSLMGTSSSPITVRRADPALPWGNLQVNGGSVMTLSNVDLVGGGSDTVTYDGCTVVVNGANEMPLDPMIEVESVTVTGSTGHGVCLLGGAAFTAGSSDLTVTGSGADSSFQYPLIISAPAIPTIPDCDLTGNALDAVLVDEYLGITTDTVIEPRGGVPYDIGMGGDSLTVASATLTIQPGAVLRFLENGLNIEDDSLLLIMGTSEAPVVLTSASEAPAAGDWIGIYLWAPWGTEHVIQHAVMEYMGYPCSCVGYSCSDQGEEAAVMILSGDDGWLPDSSFVTDTTIRHSAGNGIDRGWKSDSPPPDFTTSNTFEDIAWSTQTLPIPLTGDCP